MREIVRLEKKNKFGILQVWCNFHFFFPFHGEEDKEGVLLLSQGGELRVAH